MWIRSQNKKELIDCNNFSLNSPNEFYVNNSRIITDYEIVCYPFENSHCILGKYSTKAKALKVLDEIQEMINQQEEYKAQGEDRNEGIKRLLKFVYQMPQDSEVKQDERLD